MGGRFNVDEMMKVQRQFSLRQSYHNPTVNGEPEPIDAKPVDEDEEEEEEEEQLERWVLIQKEAFTNWCNDKLKGSNATVKDIKYDFRDGSILCKLMEVLKGRPLKGKVITKSKLNWVTANGNIALAMKEMREDGINMVNIGPEDIVGGNTKLILGMLWILIRRYQIGSQTKVPPKKLMLAWINACLHPHITVNNFSTDWNDGKALHGVIEYCKPGTCPDWWRLDRYQKKENCQAGLNLAFEEFGIPRIISAQHLASEEMDELSGMTFMSYFMAENDSCGYQATLRWLHDIIDPIRATNFDVDWNDGRIACALVSALGGDLGWPDIDTTDADGVCEKAIEVSAVDFRLPVKAFISARDMTNPEVDHIGIMAYAAWHRHGPDTRVKLGPPVGGVRRKPEPIVMPIIEEEEEEPEVSTIRSVRFAPAPSSPRSPSPYEEYPEPDVTIEAAIPSYVPLYHVVTAEAVVYSHPLGKASDLTGTFTSPTSQEQEAEIFLLSDGKYNVTFQPDEIGTWFLDLLYKDQSYHDLPYKIQVVDPQSARVIRDNYEVIEPEQTYAFTIDTSDLNYDDLDVEVEYLGSVVPYTLAKPISNIDSQMVQFTPEAIGIYTVTVKCLGIHIEGSPFDVLVKDNSILTSGQGLLDATQGMQTKFVVDVSNNTGKKLQVKIKDTYEFDVKTIIAHSDTINGQVTEYSVFYTPENHGKHKIEVMYADQAVTGSPFYVDVRPPKVFVRDLKNVATMGHKHVFTVDASQAAKGLIEIDSDLPVLNYEKTAEKQYKVTVMPKKLGNHDLKVKYNGAEVSESPFPVKVIQGDGRPNSFMKGPRILGESQIMRDGFEYS